VLERDVCMREGVGSGRYILCCSCVFEGGCAHILLLCLMFVCFWDKAGHHNGALAGLL
jgi:hypothetical protein